MINDLKPYPAMKDSGVPWLGKVPEHWDMRRMKYLLRERDVRSAAGTEQLLRVSQFTGVTERKRGDSDKEPDTRAESLAGYKLVEPDNLVVNIMLAWNGSMGVSRFSGITSPAYCVYRFRPSVKPWYFHHLLRSPAYKARIKAVSTGIVESRLRLYSDDLYRLDGLLPPVAEQTAIVRFLNHAERKIRRYIRAKQKLIKLLEEQKQSIIHRAVTRGLDPDVRLKASGVEWLGDVPEHWEVASLRHRYSQVLGKMLDSKRITGENLLPYLRNVDVQWDRINVDDLPRMDITPAEYDRYTVREGDLLVCEGGEVGRAAIWAISLPLCGFQKALHRLRPYKADRDCPRYLFFALRTAAKCNAFSDGHVSTIAHLTGEKLRSQPFPFPPKGEQSSIAERIDGTLINFDILIERAAREIALLHEYRTRLITDVVTGKLDVREAAAGLPEEAEPMDSIDPDDDLQDLEDLDPEAEEQTEDP